MRVHHALGIAGGAGSKADGGAILLAQVRELVVAGGGGQPLVVVAVRRAGDAGMRYNENLFELCFVLDLFQRR